MRAPADLLTRFMAEVSRLSLMHLTEITLTHSLTSHGMHLIMRVGEMRSRLGRTRDFRKSQRQDV